MLNIEDINNTILELENGNTTFDSCAKLSSLYIVREYYLKQLQSLVDTLPDTTKQLVTEGMEDIEIKPEVVKEYADILPEYSNYCRLKTKFQNHEMDISAVLESLKHLCIEINEFIQILFSNTDSAQEIEILKGYLKNFTE